MLEIRVGKRNYNSEAEGEIAPVDFTSVSEAILAVPYEEKAVIYIENGIYHEKIFSDKKDITFVGEGIGKTVIEYSDCANDICDDGSKRGTFRSYTAFFAGEKVTVKNMSIRNNSGDGSLAGQALAVYADANKCYFENVELFGHQDTLFMSPLPLSERQKNGFMGPRVLTERKLTSQYYKNCIITGDVDFVFGGADAVFDNCTIICNNRRAATQKSVEGRFINGYITAGCGIKNNTGMIFRNCTVKGAEGCDKNSVFLGRPWRDEAKAVFLNCTMDDTIATERFSGWGAVDKMHPDTFYGEYGTISADGEEIELSGKNSFVKDIDENMVKNINHEADLIVEKATGIIR